VFWGWNGWLPMGAVHIEKGGSQVLWDTPTPQELLGGPGGSAVCTTRCKEKTSPGFCHELIYGVKPVSDNLRITVHTTRFTTERGTKKKPTPETSKVNHQRCFQQAEKKTPA